MSEHQDNDDQQEVGLYEKLAARTAELLEEGKKTLDEALKKAKEELSKAGDLSGEQLDKIADYVKRDVAENAGKATEAVKIILERGDPLVGRLLQYDSLQMEFRTFKLRRNKDCPVCGDHPTITDYIDYEHFCSGG